MVKKKEEKEERDPDNNFIANELENMFDKFQSKKSKGYSKLNDKWKRKDSFSSFDDESGDECGPEAPGSKKYLGEKVQKLTREQEL